MPLEPFRPVVSKPPRAPRLPGGMRRRWWLFRPLDLIARHWPLGRARAGVLVVRMDGIGDMVLFRRALDRYAEAFGVAPADVTVLGCESWAGLAATVFAGYRVIALNEHRFAKNPLYRFRWMLRVRRLAPSVAVNDAFFRRALMADSLTWVAGAPRTIASLPYISDRTRPEFTYYLSQCSEVIDTGNYPVHEIVRHARFLSAVAGREVAPEPPRIAWREAPPPLPDGAPYLVLVPGSNEPGRRWPLSDYAAIGARALAAGFRVVLAGTPDQVPADPDLDALRAREGCVDLVGKTKLAELLDLFRHAAAVLVNDTGPAHLSIALGAPTVVIVGGGHFGSFVPYPPEACPPTARFVHHEMPCYHCFWRCHLRQDPRASFPCVAAVPVDAVWDAIRDLPEAAP